jgi:drug/metabolite transporter (DMT)-like permease
MTSQLKACIWMLGAVVSFSAMALAGRAVSVDLDTFVIMTYRSLVGVVVIATMIFASGGVRRIQTDRFGLHLIRKVCHFTGQNLWFYALTLIPLAQLFALEFTTPLWVLILSPLLLSERLTRVRILVALIGFLGVLIVTRPMMGSISAGTLTAASSAIFFAGSILFTRKLTADQTTLTILTWLVGLQAVFGIICAGIDGDIAAPSLAMTPFIIIIGFVGLLAHACLVQALSLAPVMLVVPIDFLRLPLIAVLAMILFGEHLDPWVFVGAAIIFGANYTNIWAETRNSRT